MRDFRGKRYWLIGASDGLGAALAEKLSRVGAELILSARSEDKLTALAEKLPGKAQVVPCDVSDSASVAAAAEAAGEVDGMVFLAGVYWPLSAQDWDSDKIEAMADINFTGAVRAVGAVLQPMIDRDAGHIVITGSLAGYRGLRGAQGYGAAKAGCMWLAEGLHADLHKTGVKVQLANPGYIRTQLTDKNDFDMPQLMEPAEAAQHMLDLMGSDRFQSSFPAPFAWLFRVGQVFPDWLWYPLFGRK